MKPITKNSSLLLILFLLAYTCSKEKEDTTTGMDQETIEVVKAANKTAAEWKKFNDTAEKLLAITATNLKTLSVMREKTQIVDEQESLFLIYTESKNQYNELKGRLTKENAAFKKDIINYDGQTQSKYQAFKNQYLEDILYLNNNLEDLIEEIGTGPMKKE